MQYHITSLSWSVHQELGAPDAKACRPDRIFQIPQHVQGWAGQAAFCVWPLENFMSGISPQEGRLLRAFGKIHVAQHILQQCCRQNCWLASAQS